MKDNWISVETPPYFYIDVKLKDNKGNEYEGYLAAFAGCFKTSDEQIDIPNITHWMPLPTPPQN